MAFLTDDPKYAIHSSCYGYVARDPYEHQRKFKASMKLNFELEGPPDETIEKRLEDQAFIEKAHDKEE